MTKPEIIFDMEAPDIVLMFANAEDYVPAPLFTITLGKENIQQAKEILLN